MMMTPNDPAFEQLGDGCCEEALFLVKADDGNKAIVGVHLCDCDEESPSGYAWDFTVYKWDGEGWLEWDGGRYWDYESADAMLDFELPADFSGERIKLADLESGYSRNISDLLDANNMFSQIEWEAACDLDGVEAPEQRHYPLTGKGIEELLADYAGTVMEAGLAEAVKTLRTNLDAYAEMEDGYKPAADGEMEIGDSLALLFEPGYGYPTSVLDSIEDFEVDVRDVLFDDPWFECEPGFGKLFDHWA